MRVSAVVPTKNEAGGIVGIVEALRPVVDEILVVDGHSVDGTREAAKAAGARVLLDHGKGKGDAYRVGIQNASGDVLVFIDADGSHNARDVPALIQPIIDGTADLVVASRHRGGSDEWQGDVDTWLRAMGSGLLSVIINKRWGSRLTDVLNGFRAARRDAALTAGVYADGFDVEQHMIVQFLKHGFRVTEVPSHEQCRQWGNSKLPTFRKAYLFFWRLSVDLATGTRCAAPLALRAPGEREAAHGGSVRSPVDDEVGNDRPEHGYHSGEVGEERGHVAGVVRRATACPRSNGGILEADAPLPGNRRVEFGDYYAPGGQGRLFRWLDRAKLRQAASVVAGLGDAPRILDLGCGAAALSSSLAHRFPNARVCGADADDRLLEMAGQQGLEVHRVDFDQALPFPDNAFDMILMVDAIEHVRCRRDTLREVTRILRPGGTFLVFTPPYDTFTWWLGERLFRLITRRPTGHVSPFTRESLEWLLNENFLAVSTGYLNLGLTLCGVGRNVRRDSAGGTGAEGGHE